VLVFVANVVGLLIINESMAALSPSKAAIVLYSSGICDCMYFYLRVGMNFSPFPHILYCSIHDNPTHGGLV
jgi:hypothetical protein